MSDNEETKAKSAALADYGKQIVSVVQQPAYSFIIQHQIIIRFFMNYVEPSEICKRLKISFVKKMSE